MTGRCRTRPGMPAGAAGLCLLLLLAAGCVDLPAGDEMPANETEQAIAIALADPEVRRNIPIEEGEYEIVEVTEGYLESTGPEGTVAGTCTVVVLRPTDIPSRYRVYVDVENETIVSRTWQYVKDPPPCMYTAPPLEVPTLKEAAAALPPGCALAAPEYLPSGYALVAVRIFGDPCPRRDVVYTNETSELRLVQTCAGDPPYPFALSMPSTKNVTVNGQPGKYVEGIGQHQLSWSDGSASFCLQGPLPEDELAAVAASVRPYPAPP
ncbi:MAG: DUF4367 domain-containing protein [Methanomicrobiaceae archaeon]|uniref:DUF4367 domain-containing protein n=1 Tax=hydrocarbon metagenome TaxID=938273 RepID=A0A0W8FIW8_9ZZZZ|nr:DUF4367 domain-containing protein [Methanomicrobiaceae archaeon]